MHNTDQADPPDHFTTFDKIKTNRPKILKEEAPDSNSQQFVNAESIRTGNSSALQTPFDSSKTNTNANSTMFNQTERKNRSILKKEIQ